MTRSKKMEKSVDSTTMKRDDNLTIEISVEKQFPFGGAEKSEDENSVYFLDNDPRYYIQLNEKNKKNSNPKKKKIQIWFIRKTKTKGRMKDREKKKYNNSSTLREHNKFSDDNIIRKVKIYFTKSLLNFVNELYQEEYEELNKKNKNKNSSYDQDLKEKKWILPLEHKIVKKISKQENLDWFNMTIKEYLSSNISRKFNYPSEHNKQKINNLCKENKFEKLIQFLEKEKIKDIFDIYANNRIYSKKIGEGRFPQFSTLKDDLNEILIKEKNEKSNEANNREEEEDEDEADNVRILENTNENINKNSNEDYINKIQDIAIKLYDIFEKKGKRENKKQIFIEKS